jgi:hypothetical protein
MTKKWQSTNDQLMLVLMTIIESGYSCSSAEMMLPPQ